MSDRRQLAPRQAPPPPRWYQYSHTATGLTYWLRYAIGEPRSAAARIPG
ncbi:MULTISPECIES: hypothetical protein [Actinomycetes]